MNSRTHLIIGASSGLGWAITKALCDRGESVRAFVRSRHKAEKVLGDFAGAEIVEGNAYSINDLENAVKGVSTLFYCINVPYPRWKKEIRQLLSISVSAAAKLKVKLVFPGNVYVYGHAINNPVKENHPLSAHTKKGKLRIEMEQMLADGARKSGLVYTIVRMPDFYGPYVINGYYDRLFACASKGEKLTWYGDLDVPTEFIYIEDAGRAMITAGLSEASNCKMFNVPGYKVTTARAFLYEMASQGGKGSRVATVNSKLSISFGGLFNAIVREFREMMYLKQETFLLDGTLFKNTFGSFPETSYKDGIRKTMEWIKEYSKAGYTV